MNLVELISRFEHVFFVCDEDHAKDVIVSNPNVTRLTFQYDDIWARDISPTFVVRKGVVEAINWRFNAWGGKKCGSYYPWDKDDRFGHEFAEHLGIPCMDVEMVLEGGAILSDGAGTVFTTRDVLLNPNRNPSMSESEAESILKTALGADRIMWIDKGLVDDETDGHIDNVMSVIRPGELMMAWTDDKSNPNYSILSNIEQLLKRNYGGIIHKVPLPSRLAITQEEASGLTINPNSIQRAAGHVLSASYLNYYYVNGGVIIPSFGCSQDEEALRIFEQVFPGREVVQLYSREPLIGGGGIHCILHEIPAAGWVPPDSALNVPRSVSYQ
jgi:agmatine deiminase